MTIKIQFSTCFSYQGHKAEILYKQKIHLSALFLTFTYLFISYFFSRQGFLCVALAVLALGLYHSYTCLPLPPAGIKGLHHLAEVLFLCEWCMSVWEHVHVENRCLQRTEAWNAPGAGVACACELHGVGNQTWILCKSCICS